MYASLKSLKWSRDVALPRTHLASTGQSLRFHFLSCEWAFLFIVPFSLPKLVKLRRRYIEQAIELREASVTIVVVDASQLGRRVPWIVVNVRIPPYETQSQIHVDLMTFRIASLAIQIFVSQVLVFNITISFRSRKVSMLRG